MFWYIRAAVQVAYYEGTVVHLYKFQKFVGLSLALVLPIVEWQLC